MFYSFNTTFGFPNFKEVSNYSEFSIAGYGGDILAVYVSIKYASGNNLFFKSFRGVTSCPAYASLSQPELSGVFIPEVRTLVGTKMVDFDIASKLVLSCPANILTFSGVELDLGSTINIFSDLQLSFSLQGYIDLTAKDIVTEEGDIIKNTGDSNYKATINLSFAF